MVTTPMHTPTVGYVVSPRVPSMTLPSAECTSPAAAVSAIFAGIATSTPSTHTNAWLGGTTGLGDAQGASGTKRIHPGRLGGTT